MSLNYNLTKIRDYENLCWVDTGEKYEDTGEPILRLDPILQTIVFTSMIVGLSSLTEENIDEWVYRISMLALAGLDIPYSVWDREKTVDKSLDKSDLVLFIGLTVNVTTLKTAAWKKELLTRMDLRVKDMRWRTSVTRLNLVENEVVA